jgi:hypothetical protein
MNGGPIDSVAKKVCDDLDWTDVLDGPNNILMVSVQRL